MFAVVICVILSMFTELACLEFHCENVMDCVSLVHCLFTIHKPSIQLPLFCMCSTSIHSLIQKLVHGNLYLVHVLSCMLHARHVIII